MNRRARLPGADELFRSTGVQPITVQPTTVQPAAPAGMSPSGPAVRRTAALRTRADGGQAESSSAGAVEDDGPPWAHDSAGEYQPPRTVRSRRTIPDARPTGRERHDEKITVYCSPEELLQIEHARLNLRGSHGLVVDRGRIVREAIAVVLADLEAKGDASILVRRLRGR